jgi:uncharacterized membrane protein HdeD (DUF308 family)
MIDFIQKNRNLFLFESVMFIIFGLIAIALPGLFTLGIELLIGWLFLIGGIVQGYQSFKGKEAIGFWSRFLSAILSIIIGILLLVYPLTGVLTLTFLLAFFFLVDGVTKIVWGIQMHSSLSRWGWLVFSGVISILLSAIIWSGWPGTAAWVIGLLVGINMLFFGFSLLSLTLSVGKDEKS